jgi:hypothetical protein
VGILQERDSYEVMLEALISGGRQDSEQSAAQQPATGNEQQPNARQPNTMQAGLLVNPDRPACSFYMKHGHCQYLQIYGAMCKYNHPGYQDTCLLGVEQAVVDILAQNSGQMLMETLMQCLFNRPAMTQKKEVINVKYGAFKRYVEISLREVVDVKPTPAGVLLKLKRRDMPTAQQSPHATATGAATQPVRDGGADASAKLKERARAQKEIQDKAKRGVLGDLHVNTNVTAVADGGGGGAAGLDASAKLKERARAQKEIQDKAKRGVLGDLHVNTDVTAVAAGGGGGAAGLVQNSSGGHSQNSALV